MPMAQQQKGTQGRERVVENVFSGQLVGRRNEKRLVPMTPKLHITMNVLRPKPKPELEPWPPDSL